MHIKNYPLKKNSKIVVFGASGLVGSAIIKKLLEKGYKNIIGTIHKRKPLTPYPLPLIPIDLTNQQQVENFFKEHKPEYIFLAAAKVGGIVANNTYRADFIYENLQIQNNVIHNAYKYGVRKLMFLGSTCIYPKNCPQPIKEEYLLTGELEYTNEPYAIAKIAGIKMCESYNLQYGTNFISVMPTNLYGENDNFDLETSHVLPALIRKIHLGKLLENVRFEDLGLRIEEDENWKLIRKDLDERPIEGVDGSASKEEILKILNKYGIKINNFKNHNNQNNQNNHNNPNNPNNNHNNHNNPSVSIEIWGTGKPMREFLYSDDMADACVFLMENIDFEDIVKGIRDKGQVVSGRDKGLGASGKGQGISGNKTYPLPLTPLTPKLPLTPLTPIKNTHINIGTGKDISIKDLAYLIKNIIGFKGDFYFNTSKPDGTMRKVTDVSKLHSLGWKHSVELKEGIERIYKWYLNKKIFMKQNYFLINFLV